MPPLSAFRVPSRLLALAFVFLTATACGGPASTTSSAAAVGHGAQVTPGERRAVLAFSGSYMVKSVVTATTGTYGESVGAVHFYTWQAVPDCSSQSCVVKVTSSTGSHTTFVYSDGKSNKFWNIDLRGTSFTVTFGKAGAKGQTQTKDFPDEAKELVIVRARLPGIDQRLAEQVGVCLPGPWRTRGRGSPTARAGNRDARGG